MGRLDFVAKNRTQPLDCMKRGALQNSAAKQEHQLGPKRTWLVPLFALEFGCEDKNYTRTV